MRPVLFLAVLAIVPLRAASEFPAKGSLSTARHRTLQIGGLAREFLIQPVEGAGPFPIVVLLHGGTQTMRQMWIETSLPTLAARDRFILVAPQGIGRHWNDGRGSTLAGDRASTADDIGFLHSLIGEIVKSDRGDAGAVFMIGVSNGGFMSMHYACSKAGDLRAAGNVISDLPTSEASSCRPAKSLPWISINGTADPLIPFDGQAAGVVRRGKAQQGLLSADATFAFWADRAGCMKSVQSERLPALNSTSASSWAEKRVRTGCDSTGAGGSQSVQYVLHGAGHTMPNTREGAVVRLLGGSNQDIDAGVAIWTFFRGTLRQ
jgi:polyhydroxybutyrate depolymerase